MALFPTHAQPADQVYIDDWLSQANADPDSMVTGFVAAVAFVEPDGTHRFRSWHIGDGSLEVIGLAESLRQSVLDDRLLILDEGDDGS